MSKPILIPKDTTRFKHAHLVGPSISTDQDKELVDILYCTTERPHIEPDLLSLLGEAVRDFTPCGQEIYWRLK